jgi:hypothetical protein
MGVDYYNCDLCKEIYADCGGGYCDFCRISMCGNCYSNDTTEFQLDEKIEIVICNEHYEKSNLKATVKYFNDKYKDHGIRISSNKHFLELMKEPECRKCKSTDCDVPKNYGYHKYECCVCYGRNPEDVCKGCLNSSSKKTVAKEIELSKACKDGNTEIVSRMIALGAKNLEEGFYKACKYGHLDIFKLLERKWLLKTDESSDESSEESSDDSDESSGGDSEEDSKEHSKETQVNSIQTARYKEAFRHACENYHIEIMEHILTKVPINMLEYVDFAFSTNLKDVVVRGYELLELCIKHGCSNYQKYFYRAIRIGDLKMTSMLLEKCTEKGIKVDYNEALLFACMGSHSKIIELMLDHGADNYNECLLELCRHDGAAKPKEKSWEDTEYESNIHIMKLLIDKAVATNPTIINECFLIACASDVSVDKIEFLMSKGPRYLRTGLELVNQRQSYRLKEAVKKAIIRRINELVLL